MLVQDFLDMSNKIENKRNNYMLRCLITNSQNCKNRLTIKKFKNYETMIKWLMKVDKFILETSFKYKINKNDDGIWYDDYWGYSFHEPKKFIKDDEYDSIDYVIEFHCNSVEKSYDYNKITQSFCYYNLIDDYIINGKVNKVIFNKLKEFQNKRRNEYGS